MALVRGNLHLNVVIARPLHRGVTAPSRPFINTQLLRRAQVANSRSIAFMRALLDSSGIVRTAMKRVAESTITNMPIFRLEDKEHQAPLSSNQTQGVGLKLLVEFHGTLGMSWS